MRKFQKGYFQNKGALLAEESYKWFRPPERSSGRDSRLRSEYLPKSTMVSHKHLLQEYNTTQPELLNR